MRIRPLDIEGAFEVTPVLHTDRRGRFLEWYRFDRLAETIGQPLRLAQANLSVSVRDTVRGIHYTQTPPGQAKYVTCVRGAVFDVVVDLRVGSPTFARWAAVHLDDSHHKAVYIAEGLGHGFCALTDNATLAYLCSATHQPERDRSVHPLDPQIQIAWPLTQPGTPLLSNRDSTAPGLAQARTAGLLPDYASYQALYTTLDQTSGYVPDDGTMES